jgi:surface-anchored protein
MSLSLRRSLPVAAVLTALSLTVPLSAGASTLTVLSEGHVDVVGVAYEDGDLHVHVHDEENDVEYQPHQVILKVKPEAQATIPSAPEYSFLGTAGQPVWILPEVEQEGLLFAGFGAEELPGGVFTDDKVKVKFVTAFGPGDFALFTNDETPNVVLDSDDPAPNQLELSAGGHLHANWAFNKAGWYVLVFKVTGTLAAGDQTVSSGLVTYTFKVG